MAGRWRRNPVTSEAEAFRWLVVIAAGVVTVVLVDLVLPGTVAALWALLLVVVGITYLWVDYRRSAPASIRMTRGGDGCYRVLVLANQTVRSPKLIATVLETSAAVDSKILLVVPTLLPGGDVGGPRASAAAERERQRMELTVLDLKQADRNVTGKLGEKAPSQALRDALTDFAADEVIVSTLPRERSHWLEQGVVERARMEFDIPIRHVISDTVEENLEPGDA